MTKYCINCGAEIESEDTFCLNCGKKIDGDAGEPVTYSSSYNIIIVLGYILSFIFPFAGIIVATYLLTRKDIKNKMPAVLMIIISIIMLVIMYAWLDNAYSNVVSEYYLEISRRDYYKEMEYIRSIYTSYGLVPPF